MPGLVASLDYYEEAGSLLIRFGEFDEESIEADARVIIGLRGGKLSSIEILVSDKKVTKKLAEVLKAYNKQP